MSILRVNDETLTQSHGQQASSDIIFYASSELPLTIGELLDKSRYYFPGEDIVFTITAELKTTDPEHPDYVTTLDEISLEDTLPDVVVITSASVSITGGLVNPNPVVDGQKVTITGISLDPTHAKATITIPGKIKDTF
jgi:hypothetical protein